jgi:hypothetical protein
VEEADMSKEKQDQKLITWSHAAFEIRKGLDPDNQIKAGVEGEP